MAKKKSEGKEVRIALDGPSIEHDKLIDFITARNADDTRAASVSATSRALIGGFIEDTGVNSQALSWMRTIIKKLAKDDGQHKAMDVIRSVEAMLPMIKAHVAGQSTVDMFDSEPATILGDDEQPDLPTEEEIGLVFGEGGPIASFEGGPIYDADDIADEAEAFDDHLDSVVPFKGAEVA